MSVSETETYRTQKNNVVESSDEEGEVRSSSDDDEAKIKNNNNVVPICDENAMVINTKNDKRKKNNIWGSVLTDQTSNDISTLVGAVGAKHYVSRGPESFDATLAFREKQEERAAKKMTCDDGDIKEIEELLENKRKEILSNNKDKKKETKIKRNKHCPKYKPGQKVFLNKKNELSESDDPEKVSEEISFRLWEPKRHLIKEIVEAIGVPNTLRLFNETEKLEGKGGLLTVKGDRRRTPGGVFIYLLRKDEDVDQEVIKKILELNNNQPQFRKRKNSEANRFCPTLPKQLREENTNETENKIPEVKNTESNDAKENEIMQ